MSVQSEHAGDTIGSLIEARLTAIRKSQRWFAEKLGLSPTFVNLVIKGERTFNPNDMQRAAAVLGIAPDTFLRAAGHDPDEIGIGELGAMLSTHSAGKVTVVSDPRFLDSVLFLAICAAQPFASSDIEFDVIPASWAAVPDILATQDEAVGFFNRRLIAENPTYRPIRFWTDLCLYRGYAVIGRARDFAGRETATERLEGVRELRKRKGSIELVTIGLDAELLARRWIRDIFDDDRERNTIRMFPSHDADFALAQFIGGTLGDLFVGGLPQRDVARMEKECVEVTSSQEDALWFSFNSLLCTEKVYQNRRGILYLLQSLWAEVVQRLYKEPEFRRKVATECVAVAKRLGVAPTRMSISEDRFIQMFEPLQGQPDLTASGTRLLSPETELFISTPRDVSDAYLRIVQDAAHQKAGEDSFTMKLDEIINDIKKIQAKSEAGGEAAG